MPLNSADKIATIALMEIGYAHVERAWFVYTFSITIMARKLNMLIISAISSHFQSAQMLGLRFFLAAAESSSMALMGVYSFLIPGDAGDGSDMGDTCGMATGFRRMLEMDWVEAVCTTLAYERLLRRLLGGEGLVVRLMVTLP